MSVALKEVISERYLLANDAIAVLSLRQNGAGQLLSLGMAGWGNRFSVENNGQVLLPNATAAGQGVLLGGDAEIYRDGANILSLAAVIVRPRLTPTTGAGAIDINALFLGGSITVDGQTGNVYSVNLAQNTLAAGAATVVPIAASLYIAGAPIAGLNVTITTPYALWVDAGIVRFDDTITFGDETVDIGTSTVGLNDLHFGLGGIINFDGGDVTLTHSANVLAMAGGDLSLASVATTGYGFYVTNSTITSGRVVNVALSGTSVIATAANTGSLAAFSSTSTAFTAATNTLVSIYSSGANTTDNATVQGLSISVLNTGTHLTRTALTLAATSGGVGSSFGNALLITAGIISQTSAIGANTAGTIPDAIWTIGGSLNRGGAGVVDKPAIAMKFTTTLSADNANGAFTYGVYLNFGIMGNANARANLTFADLVITPATTSLSGGTLTNRVGLYITAAPAGASNNYAIWVDAGISRFDGAIVGATGAGFILSSGAMAFQEAATISTSTGNLTIDPAGNLQLLDISANAQGVGIGRPADNSIELIVGRGSNPFTLSTNATHDGLVVTGWGAITVPAGTSALITTARFTEPNIIATGTVTLAATVRIDNAPTEATNNFALSVASGVSGFGIVTDQNVNASGSILASGGIAFTDVLNAWIDDATHGDGTTTLYIGNQTITTASDMRLKKDVVDTQVRASELLGRLRVVDFSWDESYGAHEAYNARGRWVGLLAQETVDVAPWVINAPDRNCPVCRMGQNCAEHQSHWFAQYEHLVPLLVKGHQEHEARFSTVEERIEALEEANRILRGQLVRAGIPVEV